MRAARRLLPLAAVWLLATMAEAQTKNCVRNCLALYTNEPASVRREVKPKCRAACKAMRLERGMCLKEVNAVFKTASKNCTASLKGIKKGQAPLSVHLFVGDSQDGEVEDQYATYFYEKNCKASVKFLWKDYKITCNEILCPQGQYWNTAQQSCIVNPNAEPQSVGTTTAGLPTLTPIPAVVRGFYKFSWTGSAYQGPTDTNMGVTFTGWTPGGNANGAWDLGRVQATGASNNLNQVVQLGYDGIVLDLEEYVPGQTVSIPDWNQLFADIKAHNLLCIVTISHFAPYGFDNVQALVADMLQNTDIDILSPQLYTSGTESQNDWVGLTDAWLTSVPIVAPSIVQAYYYDQLGDNSVTVKLPNAKGYFVWSNTAPTPPGPCPTPDCVRCAQQLGTNNYYWTTSVCTYYASQGGCVGNPLAGVEYKCCKAN